MCGRLSIIVARFVPLLFLVAVAWSVTEPLFAAERDEGLTISELAELWESQREEIASASIRYRSFVYAEVFAPLSPQEFDDILASYDLANRPDDFRQLIAELVNDPSFDHDPPWVVHEFNMQGDKTRDEDVTGRIDVFDGEARVLRDDNAHTWLHQPGGSFLHQTRLADFRYVPDEYKPDQLRLLRHDNAILVLGVLAEGSESADHYPAVLRVDAITGVVYRKTVHLDSGRVYREVIQSGFDVYQGGIHFPVTVHGISHL